MELIDIAQSFGIIGLLCVAVKFFIDERKGLITNEENAENRFVEAVKESTEAQVSVIQTSHQAEIAMMREMVDESKATNNVVITMLKEELDKCTHDRREQRVAILQLANLTGAKVLPEQTEPSLSRPEAIIQQEEG